MKTLKNLWYHQQIDDARETAQKMFDENKDKYDKYDSKEAFEKGMDESVKGKLGEYYEKETIQSNYIEIKEPLLKQFNEGLLNNTIKKLQQLLSNQSNDSPQVKYFESQESIRIKNENQIEETNRKNIRGIT